MINYKQKDINRFYDKITIVVDGPNSGCWEIDYHCDKNGYSIYNVNNYPIKCHRFMYMIWHQDENIDGLYVCHTCDHPWCVNPDHLFADTHQANVDDMVMKNRQAKGSVNGNSKLTEEIVEEILININSGYFKSVREIEDHYQIGQFMVYGILNENYWTHVSSRFNMNEIKNKIKNTGYITNKNFLTDDNVRDIRSRLKNGESQKNIAKMYNVTVGSISSIKIGKTHKNTI